ncbi:hypothetical protein L195_g054755, partial [Trifolium pratense]
RTDEKWEERIVGGGCDDVVGVGKNMGNIIVGWVKYEKWGVSRTDEKWEERIVGGGCDDVVGVGKNVGNIFVGWVKYEKGGVSRFDEFGVETMVGWSEFDEGTDQWDDLMGFTLGRILFESRGGR